MRTARHHIHRWFIFPFLVEDFNRISLWNWEVCSADATRAAVRSLSLEGEVGEKKPSIDQTPHMPLPGAVSVQREPETQAKAGVGSAGGAPGQTFMWAKPQVPPQPQPMPIS